MKYKTSVIHENRVGEFCMKRSSATLLLRNGIVGICALALLSAGVELGKGHERIKML